MTSGQTDKRNKNPDSVGRAEATPGFAESIIGSGSVDKGTAFNKLFASLIEAMTNYDSIDVVKIENLIIELSKLFRLSKSETIVYKDEEDERAGRGETLCCISRNRMRDTLYRLAFFDERGYPNLRNWFDYLGKTVAQKQARDKTSFRYNLRHFSLVNQEFGREIGDVIMDAHYKGLVESLGEETRRR